LNFGRGAFRLWVVFAVLWMELYGYLSLYAAQLDVECTLGIELSRRAEAGYIQHQGRCKLPVDFACL
jgi:hypothetical protein